MSKRFFCTTCQRVKRVHRLPDDVTINYTEDTNGNQIVESYGHGTCRFHTDPRPRKVVNGRARVVSGIGSTRKMSASSAKSKSKR